MKHLLRLYRQWRYRRLYQKLSKMYIIKHQFANDAISQVDEAFVFLIKTGSFDFVKYVEDIRKGKITWQDNDDEAILPERKT